MSTATLTLPAKFRLVEDRINDRLVERHEEARTSVLALLARVHHFQLGPPGIAKSLLVNTLADCIGDSLDGAVCNRYLELMSRQMKKEQVVGNISFKGLEEDRVRFNTEGMLPEAHIAFLDEIFKSSSSTLNDLLWMLNERKFRNDGEVRDVPLISMFCASNELPKGEELDALYDRIHFRHYMKRIQEGGSVITMLKNQGRPKGEPIIRLDELEEANKAVKAVVVADETYDALYELRVALDKEGLEITDRRLAECVKVVKAAAFYRGSNIAMVIDLRPVHHMLWSKPGEEQQVAERIVTSISSPLDELAMRLRNDVDKISQELEAAITNSLDRSMKMRTGITIDAKVTAAVDDLQKLKKDMNKVGYESELVEQIKTRLKNISQRTLIGLFNGEKADDPDEAQDETQED